MGSQRVGHNLVTEQQPCLKHQGLCLALIKCLIELAIFISNFAELKQKNVAGSLSLFLFLSNLSLLGGNFFYIFLWHLFIFL